MVKKYFASYWIRSAFYSILQRFSITFFGLVNFVVLIRTFSKPQMGTWALFLLVTSIFEQTKTALLKNAHVKYVSAEMDEKIQIASSSFLINLSISFIFIALILLFAPWLSVKLHTGDDLSIMLHWFIPGILCMVFFAHLEAVQQSHLDFKGIFAGYLIRQGTFFLCISASLLAHRPYTLKDVVVFQTLSMGLGTITLYLYSRKYLLHRLKPTLIWVRQILHYGAYIFASGITSNLGASLDQFMTGSFLNSTAVAYYNSAAKINGLLDTPSYAAADILFPKSARAIVEEGTEKVRYLFEKMVAILLSFSVPVNIFIIFFPKFVISLIAGRGYLAAAPILQLYMISGLARPMQNQAANLLNSIGKQAICFWMNTAALVVNLGANYILLMSMGLYGAVVGSSITYLLSMIAWYFLMRRLIGFQPSNVFRQVIETYKTLFSHAKSFLLKGDTA
jgi:lipopolysaccharide exporter